MSNTPPHKPERLKSFKEDLEALLKKYKASILFQFVPNDMEQLKYCNGFKVIFDDGNDRHTFQRLTGEDSFSIEFNNIKN